MPYIPQEDRTRIHGQLSDYGSNWSPQNAGEMNYVMTRFIDNYFVAQKGPRYAQINAMIGALELCKPVINTLDELALDPLDEIKRTKEMNEQIRKDGIDWAPPDAEALRSVVEIMLSQSSLEPIDVAGVLTCCQMELYRLIAAIYEDKKMAENGPAYTIDPAGGSSY